MMVEGRILRSAARLQKSERRDRLAVIICSMVALTISVYFDLIEVIHDYLDEFEDIQADEVFTLFAVTSISLIWYSHRRLIDYRTEFALRAKAEASLTLTQQRLMDAIENMSDGLVLLDGDLRFVMCNSRYREFYPVLASLLEPGMPITEIVRVCPAEFGSPADWNAVDAALVQVVDTGSINPEQECHLASGRWIRVSDRQTNEGGMVGIRTDITSLKLTEETLREANRRAEAASTAKSQFLANMSHELRSPLNAIIGFSEMIERRVFGSLNNAKYEEYIIDIRASGEHLLALINDILDLSKIEAEKYVIVPQPLSVPELVHSCLHFFRIRAQEAGVGMTYIGYDVPTIVADERAVKQVLINLLSNAIKFTPPGGTITLHTSSEKGSVVILVADTGEGIPAKDLPRIGQPFEQSVKPYRAQNAGTGLGLALSRKLVELHGGVLEITSQEGLGTKVMVLLPLSIEQQAA